MLDVTLLLRLVFRLFRCQDKSLREMLYTYIISDIKNMNQKGKNEKVARRRRRRKGRKEKEEDLLSPSCQL